jgi:hypothetical protein
MSTNAYEMTSGYNSTLIPERFEHHSKPILLKIYTHTFSNLSPHRSTFNMPMSEERRQQIRARLGLDRDRTSILMADFAEHLELRQREQLTYGQDPSFPIFNEMVVSLKLSCLAYSN